MKDESMNRNVVALGSRLVKSGRDLEVYKRAYVAALAMHKASLQFPKIEQYALAGQMRRSSKSVCANIVEGFAKQKFSPAEFGRYLSIAEASANETLVWLQFAFDLEYIAEAQYIQWQDDMHAIAPMLTRLRPKT